MARRAIKAAYQVKKLGVVTVYTNQARMVKEKGSEVPSMQTEQVKLEQEMFMVYFPKGHSIRINKDELIRMGYHKRPQLIDIESGEVVDLGGNPYDFISNADAPDEYDPSVEISEEDEIFTLDEEQEQAGKTAKAAK